VKWGQATGNYGGRLNNDFHGQILLLLLENYAGWIRIDFNIGKLIRVSYYLSTK
jgi:hypothetical protein